MTRYDWGFHDSADGVHVLKNDGKGRTEDLFDVSLYDPNYVNPDTGLDSQTQSLNDLRELIGYANAALAAGLNPLPVAEPQS